MLIPFGNPKNNCCAICIRSRAHARLSCPIWTPPKNVCVDLFSNANPHLPVYWWKYESQFRPTNLCLLTLFCIWLLSAFYTEIQNYLFPPLKRSMNRSPRCLSKLSHQLISTNVIFAVFKKLTKPNPDFWVPSVVCIFHGNMHTL